VNKDQTPIILAFSGGLDTSFCVPWLRETCGREVVTATVDTGGIDAAAAKQLEERAYALGAVEHVLIDARQDFFDTVIRYLISGNVLRGNAYPLCVGAERGLRGSRRSPMNAERPPSHTAARPPAMTRFASRSRCAR
jgi:argininosuccinate synthase